jgi:hypothetical protein
MGSWLLAPALAFRLPSPWAAAGEGGAGRLRLPCSAPLVPPPLAPPPLAPLSALLPLIVALAAARAVAAEAAAAAAALRPGRPCT